MDCTVYSRGAIERVPPQEVPHVIVSITSHHSDVARLPEAPMCLGVLRLSFADADVQQDPPLVLFDRERAIEIRDFVLAHRDRAELVVVHCDAGLSRSPAVAAAITRALGGDDTPWFKRYRPNALVYRKLLEAFAELD